MQRQLVDLVSTQYPPPQFQITRLGTTLHDNVVRILDTESGRTYVAKGIFHVEGNDEMGPDQMNRAFQTESQVLSRLPAWWNFGLVSAFQTESIRVIVTPELQTSSWLTYKPSVAGDRAVAYALEKQLRWLHAKNIVHGDLELKNVMLTPDGPVIIDFEKAKIGGNPVTDWTKLIDSLRSQENTRRIGDFLEERKPGRRKSVGGSRKSRRKKRRPTIKK